LPVAVAFPAIIGVVVGPVTVAGHVDTVSVTVTVAVGSHEEVPVEELLGPALIWQEASPAVGLDSTQVAPNGGSFVLSSQLPGYSFVPSHRRMIGPATQ